MSFKSQSYLAFSNHKISSVLTEIKISPRFQKQEFLHHDPQQTWTKLLLLRVRELLLANVQSVCTGFKLQSVSGLIMKAGCSKSCVRDWTGLQEAAIEIQWRECKASDLREIANNQDSNIQGCVASLVLYLHTCRVYLWGKKF